jgi:hypothetical protein
MCLPKGYDDGGFSGATIDRPALQQLLADLTAGRVDIVVVYKIEPTSERKKFTATRQRLSRRHDVPGPVGLLGGVLHVPVVTNIRSCFRAGRRH